MTTTFTKNRAHWFHDAFFYHIYPLGFCAAPLENGPTSGGSRLQQIRGALPHITELGCSALYLGPVFASQEHGYDTSDYYHIDSRLGSNQEFKELVKDLHAAGLRVVLDGVFNHVGRQFWAFRDLQEKGQDSAYKDWFTGVDFSRRSPHGDAFSYSAWEGHFELVTLNHTNPSVVEHILGAVDWMIDDLGIDGLRLDVAYLLPKPFLKKLSAHTRAKRQDFYLLGEVIHGDYSEYLGPQLLDAVTNYECFKGLWSSLNDGNYHEIAHSLARQFGESAGSSGGSTPGLWGGISEGHHLYNFVDNHDVDRVASTLREHGYLNPLYGLLMTMPGTPSVYYGSELAVTGRAREGGDAALRPAWEAIRGTGAGDTVPAAFISELAHLRTSSPALLYGAYRPLVVDQRQFVFMRETPDETVLVALNSEADPAQATLKKLAGTQLRSLFKDGAVHKISTGGTTIDIPAYGTAIFRVE